MERIKGLMYGVISSATFGLIPLFALPLLQDGMSVDSVMFYRFGISALVLGIWLLAKRHQMRVTFRELVTLSVLGVFYAMTALLLTTSYLYIPSGVATTIHFLYPVVVTSVMILFFKDRVSLPLILSTFMAIGGVYLLSNTGATGAVSLKGLLFVLTTVFTYAIYIVGVNKSCVHKMDGLKLTFYVLFAGSVVFGVNLLAKGVPLEGVPDVSTGVYLFLLALIPTLVSDFTLILSVQHVGSTTTAVLGCMEPLTAVCMGILFLREDVGIWQIVGILVILVAVSIVILANSKEKFCLKRLIPVRMRGIGKKAA
ncbi:MAG: DMT family transporter [Odoribacter sp.]